MSYLDYVNFEQFKGKVFKSIEVSEDNAAILFEDTKGDRYLMYHQQDCCESVYIEDICGDLQSLVGYEIIQAEEICNEDRDKLDECDDSYTWTYYKLATSNGYVTIRWYGTSNGYYSENVDLIKVDDDDSEYDLEVHFNK